MKTPMNMAPTALRTATITKATRKRMGFAMRSRRLRTPDNSNPRTTRRMTTVTIHMTVQRLSLSLRPSSASG